MGSVRGGGRVELISDGAPDSQTPSPATTPHCTPALGSSVCIERGAGPCRSSINDNGRRWRWGGYVECRVEPPPSTSVGGVQVPDVWRVAGVHIMGGGSAEHGTLSTAAGRGRHWSCWFSVRSIPSILCTILWIIMIWYSVCNTQYIGCHIYILHTHINIFRCTFVRCTLDSNNVTVIKFQN